MEFKTDEDGKKVITHVRCVNTETGRSQLIAIVVAKNVQFMQDNGYVIEDPEYLNYLKEGQKKEAEIKEPIEEPIEDISEQESEVKEVKRGRPRIDIETK